MMRLRCVVAALLPLVMMSGLLLAQDQTGRTGRSRGGANAVLSSAVVQVELKLTDEQKEKIKGLASAYSGLRDLPREERDKKMQEVNAENKKKIAEILNDEQKKRFREISLQVNGTRALGEADVAKDLGLSDDQVAKIKEILATRTTTGTTDAAARQKARDERNEKLLALLTDEQKKKFEDLKGAKFDTSKIFEGRTRGTGTN